MAARRAKSPGEAEYRKILPKSDKTMPDPSLFDVVRTTFEGFFTDIAVLLWAIERGAKPQIWAPSGYFWHGTGIPNWDDDRSGTGNDKLYRMPVETEAYIRAFAEVFGATVLDHDYQNWDDDAWRSARILNLSGHKNGPHWELQGLPLTEDQKAYGYKVSVSAKPFGSYKDAWAVMKKAGVRPPPSYLVGSTTRFRPDIEEAAAKLMAKKNLTSDESLGLVSVTCHGFDESMVRYEKGEKADWARFEKMPDEWEHAKATFVYRPRF
jgi:hypothetical protein